MVNRLKNKVWVGKVLLLCRCLLDEETGRNELAILQYMECVASLDEVDEDLE